MKTYKGLILSLLVYTIMIYLAFKVKPLIIQILFMAIGTIILLIGMFYTMELQRRNCYYECPYCGNRFRPSFKAYILSIHIGDKRRMRCPNCGMKGFHNKILRK